MDVALAIFNIGAGIGVLAAGAAIVYLAWRLTPLIRESRALAADLRRLTSETDRQLRPIMAQARELTTNVEILSEDVAVKLERFTALMGALEEGIETGRVSVSAGRSEARPVESWETREDASGT
jgi:uncharacterized protein YoxC